jgi:hypothetical protein
MDAPIFASSLQLIGAVVRRDRIRLDDVGQNGRGIGGNEVRRN